MQRRHLAATALIAAIAGLGTPAAAQQYPTKTIRMVVPFGAGSSTDIVARIVAQPLSQALGQAVVVDNKPGADGTIAGAEVKRAAPDGHTLFMATNSPLSVAPHLQKEAPYDVMADFTPLSLVGYYTFFVVTHPSVPAKSMTELVAYAKANPGKLNYATGNTTGIVSTALLATMAGIQMLHVPYKTEPPAVTELLSGQTHLMLSSYSTVAAHVKDGKLNALATTLPARSPLMPDVPTLAEAGLKDLPVAAWAALVGPGKMPPEVVARISKEVIAILARPDVKEQLDRQAFAVKSSTPQEMGAFMKDQLALWGKAMKDAGIEPQ